MLKYKTIVCDPPWPEQGGGKCKRGADRHYRLMRVSEIAVLPIRELADPSGCTLWLWTTGNYLASAIHCAEGWGFRVVTFRPWAKAKWTVGIMPRYGDGDDVETDVIRPDRVGLGQRMRCDAEIVLLCTLGKVPLPIKKHRQTLYAPRTKHSAKPDLFYQQLEAEQTASPKLDMFARVRRDGWDVYGDQVSGSITIRENA
jgi:N6-adenosine-specific RNA methylase IME4